MDTASAEERFPLRKLPLIPRSIRLKRSFSSLVQVENIHAGDGLEPGHRSTARKLAFGDMPIRLLHLVRDDSSGKQAIAMKRPPSGLEHQWNNLDIDLLGPLGRAEGTEDVGFLAFEVELHRRPSGRPKQVGTTGEGLYPILFVRATTEDVKVKVLQEPAGYPSEPPADVVDIKPRKGAVIVLPGQSIVMTHKPTRVKQTFAITQILYREKGAKPIIGLPHFWNKGMNNEHFWEDLVECAGKTPTSSSSEKA